MKKIFPRQFILFLAITCVGGFSFVHGQQTYNIYEGTITCPDGSQDPKCITAKAAADAEAAKIAYCKSSGICGSASPEFTMILDFVREMTNSIKTQGTQGEYVGKYVSPNRFKGNIFAPPTTTILSKLERNVEQKLKFGLAATAIFTSPVNFGGIKDMLGGTVLLSKNKVFLRDNTRVEDLESQVSDKNYELGLGGGWYEKINPENLQVMQNIIQTYKAKGLLLDGSQVKNGALYNNVTSMLLQMLSSAKTFLYFDTTSQFDDITRGGGNGITIMFDSTAIAKIQKDYNCARGLTNVCDPALKSFTDTMSFLDTKTQNSRTDTKHVFTDAIKRLGQTLGIVKQDDAFQTREADLLKSMYGTTKVTKSVGLKGLLIDPFTKTLSGINYSETNGSVSIFGLIAKGLFGKKDEIAKIKDQEVPQFSGTSQVGKDLFTNILLSYVSDVLDSQTTDHTLASFAETKDITPAFNVIGQQITTIKTSVLGDKKINGTLINSLGDAAELQCSK